MRHLASMSKIDTDRIMYRLGSLPRQSFQILNAIHRKILLLLSIIYLYHKFSSLCPGDDTYDLVHPRPLKWHAAWANSWAGGDSATVKSWDQLYQKNK